MSNDISLITVREASKLMGLRTATIYDWGKKGRIKAYPTPTGQFLYDKRELLEAVGFEKVCDGKIKRKVIYCRVSSKKQSDDLERQIQLLKSKYPNHELITDCASGINFKRKGLRTILELSVHGCLEEVVVAHKDRLCRFGFDLLKIFLELNGGKIVVLDETENMSSEQELAEDLLSIIHVHSCRQMGKRRYRCYKNNVEKNTDIPNEEPTEET